MEEHDVTLDDLSQLRAAFANGSIDYHAQRAAIQELVRTIASSDDGDEFDQRESVTTQIADTLDRYPIETTFREYLANADDAQGATKVSWLLDGRGHPCQSLLTPEMENLQGPALLVHNDGVFTEEDFEGLKHVGEGSKRQNRTAIGQFGRGSQTMYHWTDVPMILSGGYLLILDPQRQVLPMNSTAKKRKPGIRYTLAKLRQTCPDQLAPFDGLWGFSQDLDNYPGTIFRFPLRTGSNTSLLSPSTPCTEDAVASSPRANRLDTEGACRLMDEYFMEARISLLFLKRIKSIDFAVHGVPDSGWSVSRQRPFDKDTDTSSKVVLCSYKRGSGPTKLSGQDKWWVVIEDLLPGEDRIPEVTQRVMKHAECGLAALISTQCDGSSDALSKPIQSRLFSTLPLSISTELPIHVHATFSLSGDRQSIAIDEDGPRSHGSKWNRFLFEGALPKLYLSLLDDMGLQLGQDVFNIWPKGNLPERSCTGLLCASFWKKLPQSSRQLFPKAEPPIKPAEQRVIEMLSLTEAIFDFLPKNQSELLTPLLISLGVNLVRNIPGDICKQLELLPEVKTIDGLLLRKVLKSETAKSHLQDEVKTRPAIFDALFSIIIPREEELADLNGCHIIPLSNGDLGTLEMDTLNMDTGNEPTRYYVATDTELTLFSFASMCLVTTTMANKLGIIAEHGRFNILHLDLYNVTKLLKLKPLVTAPNVDHDSWLPQFWDYWNSHVDSNKPWVWVCLEDLDVQIFQATCNGVREYSSPLLFHSRPAVVEPSAHDQKPLCAKIPGIYQFTPLYMPSIYVKREGSFMQKASFHKLLQAWKTAAGSTTMGYFLEKYLAKSDMKVLQGIVMLHVEGEVSGRTSEDLLSFYDDLRTIPLWQSFSPARGQPLLCAKDALRGEDSRFMVPWMENKAEFVDPNHGFKPDVFTKCLEGLEVKVISTDMLLKNYVLPLPLTIKDTHWKQYKAFIKTVSEGSADYPSLTTLKDSKIAVDGKRNLRKACELYDHEDKHFKAAFRNQQDIRFIEPSMRQYQSFWATVGLRQGGIYMQARDYLCCLHTIALRLATSDEGTASELKDDIKTVLLPLTAIYSQTSPNIESWSVSDWVMISRQEVFESRELESSEIDYRRGFMITMAARKKFLSLSEIISPEYLYVCWSQVPFPIHTPSSAALRHVAGRGEPKCITVWRHLAHLKGAAQGLKQSQIADFISDLRRTYAYLQKNLDMAVFNFNLRANAVWLNLATWDHNVLFLDELNASWCSIDELVLSSSCDAGQMKAVKPGLMRYAQLLGGLGCSSIVYPTVTRPELHVGRSVANSLRQLRKAGKLLDVTYSTQGRMIQAHRVVLAAISEKCARQFNGDWNVEEVIEFDENGDPDEFLSYHTLSTMIDYAYEDEINWKEMEVSDNDDANTKETKLNLLLDLAKGADYWLITELKSQAEDMILVAGKMLINLDNVEEVRERAERVGASAVEEMCDQFIEQNQAIVDKAHHT